MHVPQVPVPSGRSEAVNASDAERAQVAATDSTSACTIRMWFVTISSDYFKRCLGKSEVTELSAAAHVVKQQ